MRLTPQLGGLLAHGGTTELRQRKRFSGVPGNTGSTGVQGNNGNSARLQKDLLLPQLCLSPPRSSLWIIAAEYTGQATNINMVLISTFSSTHSTAMHTGKLRRQHTQTNNNPRVDYEMLA